MTKKKHSQERKVGEKRETEISLQSEAFQMTSINSPVIRLNSFLIKRWSIIVIHTVCISLATINVQYKVQSKISETVPVAHKQNAAQKCACNVQAVTKFSKLHRLTIVTACYVHISLQRCVHGQQEQSGKFLIAPFTYKIHTVQKQPLQVKIKMLLTAMFAVDYFHDVEKRTKLKVLIE